MVTEVSRARRLLLLAAGEVWSGSSEMAASETFHHYRILRKDDDGSSAPACFTSRQARKRFQREARALARLRHPNVPPVHHFGREGEEYLYAMEFIEGETAEALVKWEGALDARSALRIVRQVAEALGAAPKAELVHRDIKPSNVMLVPHDDGPVVKLIDFGVAKFLGREMDLTLTKDMVGTLYFPSTEQLEAREVDARSDAMFHCVE